MCGLQVATFEKIDGRTGFDEQQNLRWFFDCDEITDGLLNSVVKQVKVLVAQALHEVSARIGDDHAHIDAIHADVNPLL